MSADAKVAENLVGVLKSLVRDEIRNQHKVAEGLSEQDRAGVHWSQEEVKKLIREFEAAVSVMAVIHQRTTGAISSRLALLAKEGRLYVTTGG